MRQIEDFPTSTEIDVSTFGLELEWTGRIAEAGANVDNLLALGVELKEQQEAMQWVFGRLLRSILDVSTWGERAIEIAAERIGVAQESCYRYLDAYDMFPEPSDRHTPDKGFTAHAIAARAGKTLMNRTWQLAKKTGKPVDAETLMRMGRKEARYWMERSIAENVSIREMEDAIRQRFGKMSDDRHRLGVERFIRHNVRDAETAEEVLGGIVARLRELRADEDEIWRRAKGRAGRQ